MCRGLMGCVLIIVNIVVMVVSLAFAAVGGILLWSKPLLRRILDRLLINLKEQLDQQTQDTVDQMLQEITKMSAPFGWALFGIGIALFVLAIIAFIGVCCHNTLCLILYAIILAVLAVAHIVALIIYFSNRSLILGYIHDFVTKQVQQYQSIESGDATSLLIAGTMTTLQCCGYNNGSDFLAEGAKFTRRDSAAGRTFTNLQYPLPCCIPTAPDRNTLNAHILRIRLQNPTLVNEAQVLAAAEICPYKFTANNSYIEVGCRQKLEYDITKIVNLAAYVSIGPLILELLLLSFAILIVVLRKKE
ncbi:hypothetical protein FGIG_00713 [Fasciola gigantica]|uniref:Tetraspanin n=1 Tax=Fasciola gigantica TaxID=46835 RepID=A0A504Y7D7_FASGI|nr:hypothetical protein FGIG_00713 [Fasciola gigantica]